MLINPAHVGSQDKDVNCGIGCKTFVGHYIYDYTKNYNPYSTLSMLGVGVVNQVTTLTAAADNNSTFTGWSGTDAAKCKEGTTQTTCTLDLVGQPVNITATFNGQYNLTVDATTGSTGKGTVSSNPTGITCQTGSTVNCNANFPSVTSIILTATPDTNSIFQGWSGVDAANCQEGTIQTTCTLDLVGNPINITAQFNGGCQIGGTGSAGGIIFYISDPVACHGLEAAPVDQSRSSWGCWGYDGTNYTFTSVVNTSFAIGTGAANTAAIFATCGTSGGAGIGNPYGLGTSTNAAATASSYSLNGYTDWYLPSIDELNLMSLNEAYLYLGIVSGAAGDGYWSSTDDYVYGVSYWYDYAGAQFFQYGVQNFYSGYQESIPKTTSLRVRAVRTF
jgi:Divergent InlB B-repeat domain